MQKNEITKTKLIIDSDSNDTTNTSDTSNASVNLLEDKENNLENEFSKIDCDNENYYSKECNKFLLKKEFFLRPMLRLRLRSRMFVFFRC